MKNLHKIGIEYQIDGYLIPDILIAQIWAIEKDVKVPRFDKQISKVELLNIKRSIFNNNDSPLMYKHKEYGISWSVWYWETDKLERWIEAGKPRVDISNIKVL